MTIRTRLERIQRAQDGRDVREGLDVRSMTDDELRAIVGAGADGVALMLRMQSLTGAELCAIVAGHGQGVKA
jgi:hypothetical protein